MATLLVMAGCSQGDDLVVTPDTGREALVDEEDFTLEEVTSDVPIVFGGINNGQAEVTRGSIDFSEFNMGDVGLFCLSAHDLPNANDPRSKTWSNSSSVSALTGLMNVWLNNVSASVTEVAGNTGNLVIDSPKDNHYYPLKKWFAYSFAAYHPRTEYIVRVGAAITAYIPIDGNDDVMYAVSEPQENQEAYSYLYYKNLATVTDANLPHLTFKRVTSRLNFKFYFDDDEVVMPGASDMEYRIDSVAFDDFPHFMKLAIAKRDDATGTVSSKIDAIPFIQWEAGMPKTTDEEGNEVYRFPGETAFGHYHLREKNDEELAEQKNSNGTYKYVLNGHGVANPLEVGDCIFIPPVYKSHSRSTIKLYVFLRDSEGNRYSNVNPILVAPPTDAGWEQNTSYTIRVKLKNPVFMFSRGTLGEDWTASAETIDVEEAE